MDERSTVLNGTTGRNPSDGQPKREDEQDEPGADEGGQQEKSGDGRHDRDAARSGAVEVGQRARSDCDPAIFGRNPPAVPSKRACERFGCTVHRDIGERHARTAILVGTKSERIDSRPALYAGYFHDKRRQEVNGSNCRAGRYGALDGCGCGSYKVSVWASHV